MRYQIGEQYPFIYVEYTAVEPIAFSYRPWMDKLVKIHMVVLTCTEHHKVAWEYEPDGEKKYDGFVFTDEQDRVWHNQYPTASYGQVDNSADFMVFPKDVDDMIGLEGTNIFTLATKLLDTVQLSFHRGDNMELKGYPHEVVALGLREFRNSMIETISDMMNVDVSFRVNVRGKTGSKIASDYVHTTITPKS